MIKLKEIQIIINNTDDLDLYILSKIPDGIIFNNNGMVELCNLKNLPTNTIFNNNGWIGLEGLKELKSGIIFNNNNLIFLDKNIDLSDLTYKELTKLSNKLPLTGNHLCKKDLLKIIREHKLNTILNGII